MGAAVAPLVGRSADLRRITDAASAARAGTTRSVVVTGEAGIGKSRLVAEAVATLDDALVVTGHAAQMSTGEIAFGVLADTLRDLVRIGGDGVLTAGERELLAPVLPGSHDSPAGMDRGRLLSAFIDLLERTSAQRLLVWVVEDLHWADSATRDVVTLVARTLRGASLLLLATVRTDDPDRSAVEDAELTAYVAGLAHAPGCEVVALEPLSGAEVLQQLAGLLGSGMSGSTLERIQRLSDGIPFVVEELASAAGRPELSTAWSVGGGRLTNLSPDARRLVDAAAVGDGHLRTSLLEAVVEATSEEFDASLLEAVRCGVLVCDPTEDQVAFRHALLREATDRAMGPGARRAWHRRWAEVLETSGDVLARDPCSLAIAEHWCEARDVRRMAIAATNALPATMRLGDERAELRLRSRVVSCWEQLDDPEAVVGATLREVVAGVVLLGPPGPFAEYVALLDSIPAHLMTDLEQAALRIMRATTSEAKGELATRYQRMVSDFFDRFDVFGEPRDEFALAVLTMATRLSPDDPRGVRATDLAAELARELGSPRARTYEIVVRSHVQQARGDPAGAADYLDRELQGLRDHPDEEVLLLQGNLMWCRIVQGDHVRAQEIAERSLARMRHPQLSIQAWEHLLENYAFSLICTGDWARARALLQEAEPWWEDDLRSSNMRLSMLALAQGGDPDVRRWAPMVGREIPGGTPQISILHLVAAEAAARGDLATARATYSTMWQDPEALSLDDYLWLILVDAARAETDAAVLDPRRADRAAAQEHLDRIREAAGAMRHYGVLTDAWRLDLAAQVERFHGLDARPALRAALEAWERLGHVPDVAVTHLSLAEQEAMHGDRAAARDHLTAAREVALRLEALPMLARAEAIASTYALGGRDRRTSEVLTDREAEVLALLAEGRTNNEIAAALVMSPKTASVHVSHIITKLGASNRTEASALARRHGLLQ